MDSKIQNNLLQAKAHFYSQRLVEAYNILRRYFDRLPFKPEDEHGEYIGMFVRVLAELGKDYELNFYLTELEKLHEKNNHPAIIYQLATVYTYLPRMEAAKKLFETIIRDPNAKKYRDKARMNLAVYYDQVHDDVAACRSLIDSIEDTSDPDFSVLVEIWKGKLLRDEKKFAEGEVLLAKLVERLDPAVNWYSYFAAKNNLALVYICLGEMDKARRILGELTTLVRGRHFKCIAVQLAELQRLLKFDGKSSLIRVICGETESTIEYESKTLSLNGKTPSDKLLLQLAKKGFLEKTFIVKSLYSRAYDAERDNKLIYYHIHSLRKRLKTLGLPGTAITNEAEGYRLIPEVETVEGET
jgi:tetratricopeptide (TPR) repeat protein